MISAIINTIQPFFQDITFYSQQYLDRYTFLVPLGIIGIWRWLVWMMKESIGLSYRPKTKPYQARVSIVTPVYNENPKIFKMALESWKENKPDEIVAVIDYTDKACIKIFKEFSNSFPKAILIITKIPGKREALATGIQKVKNEIVALVDSDTIWGDTVIRNGLPPFADSRVAGVATYQSVLNPKTFAQKIFDIQLDLRYRHEYPFLAAAGDALVCLSGRTALYRREVILPMLPKLVNETFLGKPVISGDDKRLTYLVLAAGWKVAYQSNSHVYTPGMKDLRSYLKQRIRWSRNSLRADLGAMLDGWPRRHPALFFFQIDKVLQSFVIILSP
ncbi:MAG: glycosyltransferase, partial [Candidatus Levybacteria bacterium]|nr:glycosyltransferase [Candidatus Levybacteria bacterium]